MLQGRGGTRVKRSSEGGEMRLVRCEELGLCKDWRNDARALEESQSLWRVWTNPCCGCSDRPPLARNRSSHNPSPVHPRDGGVEGRRLPLDVARYVLHSVCPGRQIRTPLVQKAHMGVLSVNMPMLSGDGAQNAFLRLQKTDH